MRSKATFGMRLVLGVLLAALAGACSGNQASVRPDGGYAQAVTAPPGSLLYYEQLAQTQSENPDVLYDLALRYAAAGDLEKAESSYKQALVIKPTHVPAAVNLSDLYRGRGNYNGAIKVLEDLFGAGVDDPRARTNLAALYRMTDRLDESLKQSIQITKKYGVLYGAKLNIGLIYYDRGRYDMALTVLNELLRENPNDAILRSSIGQVYIRQDRILQAEEQFQNAVTLDTKSFSAWNGLGLVALRKDENDEALKYFDKALEANVNYAQAYVNRGIALRKLGRFTEASESYQKAVEINPTLVDADYNRGVLFDDYAHNFTEAVVVWKGFREKPNFPADLTAEVDGRIDRLEKWLVKQADERKRRTERDAAMAEKKKVDAAKKAEEAAQKAAAEQAKADEAELQKRLAEKKLAAEAATTATQAKSPFPVTGASTVKPAPVPVAESPKPVSATTVSTPSPVTGASTVKPAPVPAAESPKPLPVTPVSAPSPVTGASTVKPAPVPAAESPKPVPVTPVKAPSPVTEASTPKIIPAPAVAGAAPISAPTEKPTEKIVEKVNPVVPVSASQSPPEPEKPALRQGAASSPVTSPSP